MNFSKKNTFVTNKKKKITINHRNANNLDNINQVESVQCPAPREKWE